jgi:ribonuclease D
MLINKNEEIKNFCNKLGGVSFVTIDTEFLREKTYYPKLCLIQLSGPDGEAAAIDPLAKGIDLDPFFELMDDGSILKVFHAARQDLEILYNINGSLPSPLFDTQIAAMVCGYGESVGYENLVRNLLGRKIDKGPQFTDWSRRPLGKKMMDYALGDVTHLIEIYKILSEELEKRGREGWLKHEEDILSSPSTYEIDPYEIYKRIKIRSQNPRTLAALRELAAWREKEAANKNIPRNWVLRDETLADIAVHMPQDVNRLEKARNMPLDKARGKMGKIILNILQMVRELPQEKYPAVPPKQEQLPQELRPVLEMLRMLLRINCSEQEVAAKLVASNGDLEKLALDSHADIPAMHGWRFEVFGRDALELKNGRLSLTVKDNNILKTRL